jgi:integrase
VSEVLRDRHYCLRTEQADRYWVRFFVLELLGHSDVSTTMIDTHVL